MKKTIIALSCFALVFGSCKKDKDEATDTTSVTTENIAGTYTVGTVTVKLGSNPETDVTEEYFDEPCLRDDEITLNVNNTAIFTDAGVKCDPPGDDTGIWALTANNTKINLDGEELDIQSFNGKVLNIGGTDNSSSTTATVTITLNKK